MRIQALGRRIERDSIVDKQVRRVSDHHEADASFIRDSPSWVWSMSRPFGFRTCFATDPAVVNAGIGLDQTQFDAVTGLT